MIILQAKRQSRDFIVLVGLGLIGSLIFKQLLATHKVLAEAPAAGYSRESGRKLAAHAQSTLNQSRYSVGRLDYIYAAGAAGFFSSAEQMNQEYDYALSVTEGLVSTLHFEILVGHLVSSAGGVYEGCKHITQNTKAAPARPYGESKLKLEKAFSSLFDHLMIYRPTSVYGYLGSGYRRGLITQLIWDAQHQSTTPIFGALHTLRDYVWAGDIGHHIHAKIASQESDSQTMILASGRPVSVFEILHKLEKYLLRRPRIALVHAENARNITFSPSVIARGFHASPLEVCLPRIVHGF